MVQTKYEDWQALRRDLSQHAVNDATPLLAHAKESEASLWRRVGAEASPCCDACGHLFVQGLAAVHHISGIQLQLPTLERPARWQLCWVFQTDQGERIDNSFRQESRGLQLAGQTYDMVVEWPLVHSRMITSAYARLHVSRGGLMFPLEGGLGNLKIPHDVRWATERLMLAVAHAPRELFVWHHENSEVSR